MNSPLAIHRWNAACAALPSATTADSLKRLSSGGKGGQARLNRTDGTVCRAAPPTTAQRPSTAPTLSPSAPKQEVVSYEGVEFEVTDNPELKSTWSHRAIVASSSLVMGLLLANGLDHSSSAVAVVCSMLAGYVFADFGSGVYHWGVDNYGSGTTPVVGSQIAAFQGHHRRPWTITEREFCNNCSLTFKPAGVAAFLLLSLSATGLTSSSWDVFAATSCFFIAMSQQFHAWSHMKKSQLPNAVLALQDANLMISRKAHGTHHRSPFNVNYCIVSGWCNPILDSGIMLELERIIQRTTGVEPRGWYEPLAEWRELEREDTQM